MNERALLVGDRERERAVERLRDACAEGRLTLAEFSDRMDAALAARTETDLDALTADIGSALPAPTRRRAPIGRITAILGSSKQRGRWRAAELLQATAVMGECTLDLRTAEVAGMELEITATAIMGAVKILVPAAAEVEMDGWCVLGSREHGDDPNFFDRIRHLIAAPSASAPADLPPLPLIRVRTRIVMGEIKIAYTP